jgi:hypothetical protein
MHAGPEPVPNLGEQNPTIEIDARIPVLSTLAIVPPLPQAGRSRAMGMSHFEGERVERTDRVS